MDSLNKEILRVSSLKNLYRYSILLAYGQDRVQVPSPRSKPIPAQPSPKTKKGEGNLNFEICDFFKILWASLVYID